MAGIDKRLVWGYVLVAAGAAMFSTKAIFIKLAYQETADAAKMLAFRMIVALPFFVGIGLLAWRAAMKQGKPKPTTPNVLGALAAGLIGYYVAMILDFEGLIYITAGLERLVLFTYPLFVIGLGWAFFGEKLLPQSLMAAAVTYAGLAFVVWQDLAIDGWKTAYGVTLVAGCAICFAFYQLFAKRYISALGSALFTSIALSGASVASLAHYAVVSGGLDLEASARFWALAAGTGLVATVLPNFLVNAGLGRIGPASAAMISTVSPIITIGLAIAILDEPFTLADGIGTILVIGGIALHTLFDLRARENVTER
jgi:drug/metabolite transporter (DMT)-like permease